MASFTSIKKMHKYLHPALKFILLAQSNQEYFEVIKLYEEYLIQSSVYTAKMYMMFLEKVIPTNITYFHFMREDELYSHYTAILYILHCGHLNESLQKRIHIYRRLSDLQHKKMLKLFSHWLFDMVKYICSAIYIKSYTMPHLITNLYTFIAGIFHFQKKDYFIDFTDAEKQ